MTTPARVVVGGVSQLFQGDLDVGRRIVDQLSEEDLGHDVVVEDFHYGAVAVAHRLEELRPDTLVLVGAERRGRRPGTVERRRTAAPALSAEELQTAVSDAGTGYVTIDLVIEVVHALGRLPRCTVTVELEPVVVEPTDELSPQATAATPRLVELVRAEVRRQPLLRTAEDIRALLADGHVEPSPALDAMSALLHQLTLLDAEGRWGRAFAERDRLRLRIATGEIPEGMTHVDWAVWWGLIEELDRLQAEEAVGMDDEDGPDR